ncbi:hypothetical protein [Vreelandella jeotgali]|nr:hypothetical protein [Halomonas jeotgali]
MTSFYDLHMHLSRAVRVFGDNSQAAFRWRVLIGLREEAIAEALIGQ